MECQDKVDVAATQTLLTWMREQGFTAATVTVGRVQLVGVIDHLPCDAVEKRSLAGNGPFDTSDIYAQFGERPIGDGR